MRGYSAPVVGQQGKSALQGLFRQSCLWCGHDWGICKMDSKINLNERPTNYEEDDFYWVSRSKYLRM